MENPKSNNTSMSKESRNIYLESLSFKDELPRLSNQARLLYQAQLPFLETLKVQERTLNFLEAGSGTGIITQSLSKFLKNHQGYGIDLSNQFIKMTKVLYPKIKWSVADINHMPYDDGFFDFIFNSYVLIHLDNPLPAIKEMNRVLARGGLLYILNPNDSTFEGPQVLQDLVHDHLNLHEGNRLVMNELEILCKQFDLKLVDSQDILVSNEAPTEESIIHYPNVDLGKMTAWSLLAYMGQRDELQNSYKTCEKAYMDDQIQFTVKVQLHTYRKEY